MLDGKRENSSLTDEELAKKKALQLHEANDTVLEKTFVNKKHFLRIQKNFQLRFI
jgi:hypothetical protein